MRHKLIIIFFIITLIGCNSENEFSPETVPLALPTYKPGTPAANLNEFEIIMESMRVSLNIPGMSSCIVNKGHIVWSKGFGYANLKTSKPASPESIYHLASLTKPFGAVILMQLVEEGILDLDDKISDFGIDLTNAENIKVRHLMTHTSEGTPGNSYKYNGGRYALLEQVMTVCTGKSFCELIRDRIINPYSLSRTAPNPLINQNCILDDSNKLNVFNTEMSQGYSSDGQNPIFEPIHFSPAAGLVSSVLDMAKFSILLDNNKLLKPESIEEMYSPAKSPTGIELAYGLGWFVNNNQGLKIIWHYGYWDAFSSFILKIPEKKLTFIILANSNMLSKASNDLHIGGSATRSIAAAEFLNAFIFGTAVLPE